jgi:hypothetical protein
MSEKGDMSGHPPKGFIDISLENFKGIFYGITLPEKCEERISHKGDIPSNLHEVHS